MGKNVPQQALMNLARAIAAEEQLSLNQRHLNEADILCAGDLVRQG